MCYHRYDLMPKATQHPICFVSVVPEEKHLDSKRSRNALFSLWGATGLHGDVHIKCTTYMVIARSSR